jgi:hypothetical protein
METAGKKFKKIGVPLVISYKFYCPNPETNAPLKCKPFFPNSFLRRPLRINECIIGCSARE